MIFSTFSAFRIPKFEQFIFLTFASFKIVSTYSYLWRNGYHQYHLEMGLRQVLENAFLHLFAKFLMIFSKFRSAFGALHLEISFKMAKNEELRDQIFTQGHFENPVHHHYLVLNKKNFVFCTVNCILTYIQHI